jgi:hypothetical protein
MPMSSKGYISLYTHANVTDLKGQVQDASYDANAADLESEEQGDAHFKKNVVGLS